VIIIDTETTNLPVRGEADPAKQPHIVEIAGIKVDALTLEERGRFGVLVNPGVPIPPETTAIHGITDAMVSAARSFPHVLKTHILPFWLGEETVVGYNVEFDLEMIWWELVRIGWTQRFPFCWDIVDAMQTRDVNGKPKRIRLNDWSREVLGDAWTPQTHRALGDCERLLECMRATGAGGREGQ
jgi:DNA polymerase III alpha subunit (gram-positive type)